MDTTAPRIPLKNHLVVMRDEVGALPIANHPATFHRLHADNLHKVGGKDCHEIPLDLIARHVNKHKDNFGAVTALLDLLANRGIVHYMGVIKGGSTDPAQMFAIQWDDEIEAPAQSHVVTDDGKTILPLDLLDAARLYGEHHSLSNGPVQKDRQSHGGQASLDAVASLDELLMEIGVMPLHTAIRVAFCRNCQGKGNASVPDNG